MAMFDDPLLSEVSQQFDRAFRRMLASDSAARGGVTPAADVYETEDAIVIELDAPGVAAGDLSVEVIDGNLVLTGERQAGHAKRFFLNERWAGRFVRSFALPQGMTGDGVDADLHDGVLRLTLRKPEESKPRRITINSTTAREVES